MSLLTPSTDRPEPVLDAANWSGTVAGLVVAVGAALVLLGYATNDQVQSWAGISGGIVTAIGAVLSKALPIITAHGARAQVTPLAAPLGIDCIPLITGAAPPVAPSVTQATASPPALQPATTVSMSAADYDTEMQRYMAALKTDEPTEPAPTNPVDRTPQPIELEAQAAATNPGLPAATGDDTGVIPTVGQPPVPAGATAVTAPTA